MRTEGSGRTATRRPPDRKARIVSAASDLFCESGYHNVSVADVAAAVGITAPALYRHFRGKPDLLLHVVTGSISSIAAAAQEAESLEAYLQSSAVRSVERRGSAVVWQREARHLSAENRADLRRTLGDIIDRIAALIRAERADLDSADGELLASAVMSVYGSISWHRSSLPRRRFERLLHRLAHTAAHCILGSSPSDTVASASPGSYAQLALSRREQILGEATRLFDERGFQSVSTEDIGEAIGTSGPSIYKHFPTKSDLLVAAVSRGGEQRRAGTARALATAGGPGDVLVKLLESYVDFAMSQSHLIGLLLGELDQLPEKERKASRQAQREYLALWVRLLDDIRPGLDATEARIVVGATLTAVDNAVRTRSLRERPDLADRLVEIGTALLLSQDEPSPS
ncbi:TetR/AcrR family transcriptional regulator [Streptomyces sp. NPDC055815]